MLKRLFSRDKLIGYGDKIVKMLVDYLVTLIFAYFAVFSVCGAIPHVSEVYTPELLFRYTAFFAAVWNILLSSAAISVLTITALFASVAVCVIYYIADPSFQTFVDSYFRWIASLFWKINAADAHYEYVTVIAVTVFFTLLLTFFATRFSNVWLVLFLIVPFAAYYDTVTPGAGASYFVVLVFGLALYYMRLRQSIYLDYRLVERDTVRFGRMPNVVMLPAVLLALILVGLINRVPADQYAVSDVNLGISARITQFFLETEENLFSGFRNIDYETDRIGFDDHQGLFLNNSGVEVLTFESHAAAPRYFYLRSYSYQNYKNGWERKGVLGVEPTENGAPFAAASGELEAARNLLINRALNSYGSEVKDPAYDLRKQVGKDEVRIHYEDINARAVFEVPLARKYTIVGTKKIAVSDDLSGSGLYSPDPVPGATTYSVDCLLITGDVGGFCDYFGDGFYDTVTEKEAESVYHGELGRFRSYAAKIKKNYSSDAGLSEEIKSLSLRITSSGKTPSDKAALVAKYLQEKYTYNARTYLPGDGSDYLEEFLFDTKTGNAAHFAGAAVL
ncbi:MAG: transglutaminase domain-containing protein, partial [Clostridia bacterium]|nr:transglutaminase domain-containing protein [Clostridia bacterium]